MTKYHGLMRQKLNSSVETIWAMSEEKNAFHITLEIPSHQLNTMVEVL